jgi:RND family efflux transporter MFP subunit
LSWRRPALLFGALLLLSACDDAGNGGGPAGSGEPPEVTVATPLMKELVEWDEFTGRFAAVQRVELRPQVSGHVETIDFADGALVEVGQRLFTLDSAPFEAAVAQAEANLADAEATLALARVEEQRAEELVARNNIPRATYDQRVAERQVAEAAVAAGRASVQQARIDLDYTTITAPIAGRISDSRVDIGSLVIADGGTPTLLSTIVSLDPIHFLFDLSEAEFLAYQRAADQGLMLQNRDGETPAQLRLIDEEGWPHEGYLDFLDNELLAESATIRARAVFANPDHLFTPGLFARVRIPGSPRYPAMLIPDAAISAQQAARLVMVVGEDDTIEQREIRPGPREFGLRVVRSGLEEGERIVINGLTRVRPGAAVTPVPGTIEPDDEQG